MDSLTRKFTRRELEAFIPSHRTIVTMENLQLDTATTTSILNGGRFILAAADNNLPGSSVLTGSASISIDDGGLGEPVTLDLTDTGVDAGTYGEPTRILVLVLDAKGRVISAEEIKLDISDVDGTLAATHGGTGLTGYTVGDLLVADTPATLAPLVDIAAGNVLRSGGVGVPPAYGKVDLTTDVTGTLPGANGGFPGGGFSGTGTYTNFTFVDGLCTSAS